MMIVGLYQNFLLRYETKYWNLMRWVTRYLGWCAGRNPPLVLTAFSYTGNPCLLLKSSTPIRPFTLQDSRFNGSNCIISDLIRIIFLLQLDVTFLLRNQGSRPTPFQVLHFSMVDGVSSDVNVRSRSPAHQPQK